MRYNPGTLRGNRVRENLTGWAFISPWLLGFLIFTAGPFLRSIYLSFTRYNISAPPRWVGLANYEKLFTQDELFWKCSIVTIKFALVSVPLTVALGVGLALLLNQSVKGMTVFRTVFFLPSIVPTVATTVMFLWILNPTTGLINRLLQSFGVTGPAWLSDATWAFWTFVMMSLWGVGGSMVIYLAGLKDIPTYLYEAAVIDGAGPYQRLRNITLPMVTPVVFFNLVMSIIGAFQYFTQPYMMTPRGGPDDSTHFYSMYLFDRAWKYLDMGYASAMAWVLFVVVVGLTALVLRTQSKWVHYGG